MSKITLNHNNVSITYDEENPPDIEVYRCPHLKCKEFYFNQEDLNTHKVLSHAQMPKSLTNIKQFTDTAQAVPQASGHFSIEKLSHVKSLNSKQTLKHYGFMLHLMLGKDPAKVQAIATKPAKVGLQMPKVSEAKKMAKQEINNTKDVKEERIKQIQEDQPNTTKPSVWDKVVEKFKGYVKKRTKLYA